MDKRREDVQILIEEFLVLLLAVLAYSLTKVGKMFTKSEFLGGGGGDRYSYYDEVWQSSFLL
jgi:hypothetical protein